MVSKKGNVDANVISVDGGRDDKCQKNKILYICYNQYEYRVYLCVYISTHTQTNCSKTNRVEFHELLRFQKIFMLNLFWVLHCTLLQMVNLC